MTEDAFTILVVEDDDATRTFLADNLAADGFDVLTAEGVRDGLRLFEQKFPDLAVVDVGLRDGSGLDLVRRIRDADGAISRVDPDTPMLVLSGRTGEIDRLRVFDRGADDFVAKPFSYPELRARIGSLLRRAQGRRAGGRLRVGELVIDPPSREVHLHGERLSLSQKEFALLRMLASDPTRVFTKEEILRNVWGYRSLGTTRTLDSHACRLRHKLAIRGERWVVNVWGVGYRLLDAAATERAAARALAVAA